MVDGRRVYVCSRCINQWDREQKSHELLRLREHGGPHPLFMIRGVWTQDPADKDYLCYGHLLFAEETVCFTKLCEFNKETASVNKRQRLQGVSASDYVFFFGAGLGGIEGAFMGAIYASQQGKDDEPERGKRVAQKETVQSVQDQIEKDQSKKGNLDLESLLEKTQSLFLYPRKTIESISYDRKHGLRIQTSDPSCKPVSFELDEDVYNELESRIQTYFRH